jgi:hypothetical protein
MRYMMILVFAFMVMLPMAAHSETTEAGIVSALLAYCMPAVVTSSDVIDIITIKKLPELPPNNARLFSKDGGRVFALPQHMGKILLLANKNGICQIAARDFKNQIFWQELEKWVNDETQFKLIKSDINPNTTMKEYTADISGKIKLIVTTKENAPSSAIQGLVSIVRFK